MDGPQAHTAKGGQIAIVPDEVYEDQHGYDGKTFPVILIPSYGSFGKQRRGRAKLRGDLYGLHTGGTGDMTVSVCG